MTDYKKIADIMQAQPVDRRTLSKDEFKDMMKNRNLKFIQDIDQTDDKKREVWGNKNFHVIVVHNIKSHNYQIL